MAPLKIICKWQILLEGKISLIFKRKNQSNLRDAFIQHEMHYNNFNLDI